MPGRLFRFKKRHSAIPKSQWNGPGQYYFRGKGKWTKYSRTKDYKRGKKVGTGRYKHTHDRIMKGRRLISRRKRRR